MSLGYPQSILLAQFNDCAERTKKKVDVSNAEELIYFMLDTSSITAHPNREAGEDRSYSSTFEMIRLINHRLCPGQWCTRGHCKNYDSGAAYYCKKTRPKVCKDYAKYIEGVERRKKKQDEKEVKP
jgi:hypothetical protein